MLMRYIYYGYGKKDKVSWGLLQDDDETIVEASGDPWRNFVPSKSQTDLSDVRLFRPLAPGQIVEMDGTTALIKAPARTFGPNDKISLPRRIKQVQARACLGVVIGKTASKIGPAQAADYILGYTGVLEFNARNSHKSEIACAFGPTIISNVNPFGLTMQLLVNDQLLYNEKINVSVAQDLSQASQHYTLASGDIILSGPQPNEVLQTDLLFSGDVIQLSIEKIGKLNLLCGMSR